jgi:hypothetical protein
VEGCKCRWWRAGLRAFLRTEALQADEASPQTPGQTGTSTQRKQRSAEKLQRNGAKQPRSQRPEQQLSRGNTQSMSCWAVRGARGCTGMYGDVQMYGCTGRRVTRRAGGRAPHTRADWSTARAGQRCGLIVPFSGSSAGDGGCKCAETRALGCTPRSVECVRGLAWDASEAEEKSAASAAPPQPPPDGAAEPPATAPKVAAAAAACGAKSGRGDAGRSRHIRTSGADKGPASGCAHVAGWGRRTPYARDRQAAREGAMGRVEGGFAADTHLRPYMRPSALAYCMCACTGTQRRLHATAPSLTRQPLPPTSAASASALCRMPPTSARSAAAAAAWCSGTGSSAVRVGSGIGTGVL